MQSATSNNTKNTVLGEAVYNHILDMILRREIGPGERIPEQKIVDTLEVSRTPVREAIRKLASEGLINVYPNRFAEVVTFTDDMVLDLGMLRITMDCLSAQYAIQNGSNKEYSELLALAKKCEEANEHNDIYSRIKYDTEFHMRFVEIGKSDMLQDVQRKVFLKSRLLQTTRFADKGFGEMSNLHQHDAIVQAIMKRDIKEAIEAIIGHLVAFYKVDVEEIYIPLFNWNGAQG